MNNNGDHKLANNNVTRSEKDGVTAHVVWTVGGSVRNLISKGGKLCPN